MYNFYPVPRRPPRTDIGSFECVASSFEKSTRDVLIYWQNINDSEKCGDSFEYRVYYTSITADNNTMLVLIVHLFILDNIMYILHYYFVISFNLYIRL